MNRVLSIHARQYVMHNDNILEIKDLSVLFKVHDVYKPAVNKISFAIPKGKTLGIVGESGSGKSVTSLSIMRLLPEYPICKFEGQARFQGQNLFDLTFEQMRKIRGNNISMIFQEPMTSLNPVFTVGDQVSEVFLNHKGVSKQDAKDMTIEILEKVRIPLAHKRFNEYPHELSGGMRQRVMIAMALACKPKLLIADEPTTALDVSIQSQIIAEMNLLQKELDMSILLVTHDLGVVGEMCDYVLVMYGGQIVETGPVDDIFNHPKHPYTIGLMEALPRINETRERLKDIPGRVPSLGNYPKGCLFRNRCNFAQDKCQSTPTFSNISKSHKALCFFPQDYRG